MNNGKNRQGLAAAAALAFGVLVLAVPEARRSACKAFYPRCSRFLSCASC